MALICRILSVSTCRKALIVTKVHTDIELFTVALAQAHVTVREKDGHIADYGGVVERYTADSVRIAGVYYVRNQYYFTLNKEV
ncbi:hypothetical protein NYE27_21250 [Paenibacillus sp. FSL R10-2779]|uniref:hypothetical protein n=1 Tax=Paenibacillus sp. FSL R10-2779 TaxID=2975340 RepID=UPI0030F6865C